MHVWLFCERLYNFMRELLFEFYVCKLYMCELFIPSYSIIFGFFLNDFHDRSISFLVWIEFFWILYYLLHLSRSSNSISVCDPKLIVPKFVSNFLVHIFVLSFHFFSFLIILYCFQFFLCFCTVAFLILVVFWVFWFIFFFLIIILVRACNNSPTTSPFNRFHF